MCPDCGRRIRSKGETKVKGDNSVAPALSGPLCSNCHRRSRANSRPKWDWGNTEYYCAHCKVRMLGGRWKRKGDGYAQHNSGDSCVLCTTRIKLGLDVFSYDPDNKMCRDCLRVLPHSSFTSRNAGTNSRALAQCNFGRDLKRKYKIGCGDYFHLLSLQNNCCKVCKTSEDNFARRLHVDHDHVCCPGSSSCGQCVRGLLCANCNIGLGKVKDDLSIIQSMVEYLQVDITQKGMV